MRIILAAPALVAVLVLGGCVAPEPQSTPKPTASESVTEAPDATPTPTPETPTPVDPAAFATQRSDLFGPGVDFDSVDGSIHCGIWESREASTLAELVTGPYAGCRPNELLTTYDTEPSTRSGGEVGCSGGQLVGVLAVEPVCTSGQAFVGEAPTDGPVGTLPVGSSIAYAGFTCTSPDASTVECVRDADGHGFTIGLTAYRYF